MHLSSMIAAIAALDSPTKAVVRALPGAENQGDDELVARALSGDRWAKEALYRRHVGSVGNAVTRILGRTADADDVLQDAFMKAFSRLGSLREPAAFGGWLRRIAINEVHSKLRRRKWRSWVPFDADGDDDACLKNLASPDASPEVRADLARLDAVLQKLDPALKTAWMLRRVEGWSLQEVADACGWSLATCKRRLQAANSKVDRGLGLDGGA